jgi:hypothetical protein
MTRPRYTEERFMSILWTLYERTSNDNKIIKYGSFCKEMNITNAIFPLLEMHKVLVSTSIPSSSGRGKMQKVYVWNTIQPNIHMARKLMEEIKKRMKEANAKHKEKVEMLKKQEELGFEKEEKFQQPEVNWEVTDMYPNATSAHSKPEDYLSYTTAPMQNPFQPIQNPFQTVTISSDQPLAQVKKEKNKKKFSIAWGLISIEW